VNEISVSGNGSGSTLSEIGSTSKSTFDGFESEVSVSTIDDLEKGDLRVTCATYS